MAWAAVAWVVAALELGAEAPVDPARAAAAERACGNPAEAVAVQAAGDWALAASGPALGVAARAREAGGQVVAEAQVVRVLAVVSVGPGLALAVAARARVRVAVEEQVLAQEELAAVQVGERELAVG